jgi:hypothetical protein
VIDRHVQTRYKNHSGVAFVAPWRENLSNSLTRALVVVVVLLLDTALATVDYVAVLVRLYVLIDVDLLLVPIIVGPLLVRLITVVMLFDLTFVLFIRP